MYLAKVTGALVSTTKHASLNGSKLLIVARLDETISRLFMPRWQLILSARAMERL